MQIAELIALQNRHHGRNRLRQSLGDGYLYSKNPTFRRIREAALRAGFRFTLDDPGSYFAFPLIALHTVLGTRRIPFRDNLGPLLELERARPGFFRLGDLKQNRPVPNYLLHESAHAVSFVELFGNVRDVDGELRRPDRLIHIMLSESFAMTAEYLAACAVGDPLHAWLFSISSYRHRTQKKQAIGELAAELGLEAVAWTMLGGFLHSNFLRERLGRRELARIVALCPSPLEARLTAARESKLRTALNQLTRMSPGFRLDTSRIFLSMFGRSRDIRRVLASDPFDRIESDPKLAEGAAQLVRILTHGR